MIPIMRTHTQRIYHYIFIQIVLFLVLFQLCCCFARTMHQNTDDSHKYLKILLSDGRIVPVDEDVDTYEVHIPSWYNEELFKRGQNYYRKNIWSMFFGKLCGLIAILAIPTILNVLVHTKQSSTPRTSYRRYIATIFHVIYWYKEELKPGSKSWKSIEAVRKRHVRMSRYCAKSQVGLITQKDMAITQFGFIGYILLKPDLVGLTTDEKDIEAFVHFWRVISYMIGIEDRFNVCTDSVFTTKQRLRIIMTDVLKPSLENTSSTFTDMCKALADGLWSFNPFVNHNAFVYYLKRLTEIKGYYYFKSEIENNLNSNNNIDENNKSDIYPNTILTTIGWYSRFILFVLVIIQQFLIRFILIRWYFNSQMILAQFLIKYFPFLALPRFGITDSYVRILKHDK